MTPSDVGALSLALSLVLTVYAFAGTVLGVRMGLDRLVVSARNGVLGSALFATMASMALVAAFLSRDFSLKYVAQTSSRDMPWDVTISSFWGGQAGSLLLWAWMLSLFAAMAVWSGRDRYRELMPMTTAALMGILGFFLFILVFVASPFERLAVVPPDGNGLNPLLWDDGMRLHPPLLLMGYMSFSIPFAYAIAALISGRLGSEWLRPVRQWMLVAWGIQGAGLLAGAWWAYHVLGWGGYWGWDPVENVALLPWLTATAFLHSTMVQERRRMLKVWNLVLVIATFTLSIFGTFVVRSGILSSVHSFAQSAIGPYFFAFLGVVIIGSLGLFFYRLSQLQEEGQYDSILSREVGFLFNNLILVSITAATLWGTVFPLISEMVRNVKISVGAPFYQQVNGPLLLALMALMGVGPLLAWRRTTYRSLRRNLLVPLALGIITGALLLVVTKGHLLASLAYGVCAFVTGAVLWEYYRGVAARVQGGESVPLALFQLISRNRRRYGGYIVHLSIVLLAVGVIGSSFFQQESVATLAEGDSVNIGRYTLTFRGLFERQDPGVSTVFASLAVASPLGDMGFIAPDRRFHRNWEQQPTTGVVILTTLPWIDDLYVLLTGWNDDGSATFRVIVNPLPLTRPTGRLVSSEV
ncbi:MAG: cytochrome c assembly protein [Dehalococcoidia bacterium]|nr:cytochrome c assembly protein [Dehalococcoidia bacterium]